MSGSSIELSSYRDQHFKVSYNRVEKLQLQQKYFFLLQGSRSEQERSLKESTTLYVGNMSFYTTEEQIHELFSRCGEVRRIIMGLDKYKKTPCGFCFVEYYTRADAETAMRLVCLFTFAKCSELHVFFISFADMLMVPDLTIV